MDQLDRPGDRRPPPRAVGRPPGDQVGVEEGVRLRAPLGGQPRPVGLVADHGRRQVGATDRPTGCPQPLDPDPVDGEAELVERGEHPVGPQPPLGPGRGELAQQIGVVRVDPVGQDVAVVAGLGQGRDLAAGDDPDAVLGPGGERLVNPLQGVVIGQGEQAHPGRRRPGHTRPGGGTRRSTSSGPGGRSRGGRPRGRAYPAPGSAVGRWPAAAPPAAPPGSSGPSSQILRIALGAQMRAT